MKPIKLTGDYKLWTVSQTQFAQILGVSQPRINQMIDEQILFRDESSKNGALFFVDSLISYYASKTSDKDDDVTVNFWKERAKNEKAKRELNELKLEKERGAVYDANVVESVISEGVLAFRNKLLGLPNKLSPQLEGKTVAQINKILKDEIYENLTELANSFESEEFYEKVTENLESNDAPAAEIENKSMGE